jgi:hypothetical protein
LTDDRQPARPKPHHWVPMGHRSGRKKKKRSMRENGNIVDCGDGKLRRRRREFGRGGTVDGRAATCRWTKLGVGLNDVLNGVSYTFAAAVEIPGVTMTIPRPGGFPGFCRQSKEGTNNRFRRFSGYAWEFWLSRFRVPGKNMIVKLIGRWVTQNSGQLPQILKHGRQLSTRLIS